MIYIPEIRAGPNVLISDTTLPLHISFDGPTVGGGITLEGGTRISQWRDLTVFVVADAHHSWTQLNFKNEELESDCDISAIVASFRPGLRGHLNQKMHASLWTGAMIQYVDQPLERRVPGLDLRFALDAESEASTNALIGGRLEMGPHWDFLVEGGIGERTSILGALTFRF